MSYKAKVIQVMIATPSDVANERQVAQDVIHEWNVVHSKDKDIVLLPVGWESHSSPAMGDRPQAILNKQMLKDCDLLIAVFWTRLGTPTGKSVSGTVEEIEEHLKAAKPAMIYFSSQPIAPGIVDQKQLNALFDFKEECRRRGLIAEYKDPIDFKALLARQLAHTVLRHFSKKNGRTNANDRGLPNLPPIPELSDRARLLLREAVQDDHGTIACFRTMHGLQIVTHGINLVEMQEPAIAAKWETAVRQLREGALIQDRGRKGEIYAVTHEGYEIAKLLRPEPIAV